MAKRPTVPKFGNWENEGNAPYTTYFNEARKGKAAGGKMINPNDPEENPEMFAENPQVQPPPPAPRARPSTQPDEPVQRPPVVPPTHDHRATREEEHPPSNDNSNRRNPGQRGGTQGVGTGRPVRQSVGSDHSFDRSPLHPHYQAKVTTGKGGASPAWEGKNSYDSSHGTPGRSRMKPTRGDDSPDNGAAVPRFGDWDDNNPSSGENYTHIFNKVREERVTGSPMGGSGLDARPNYNIPRNQKTDNKCCCFPWSK